MIALVIFSPSFHLFQQSHVLLFVVFLFVWVASYLVLVYGKVVRKYPHNLIVTAAYTLSQSYSVSYICGLYLVPEYNSTILTAALMTLGRTPLIQV